MLVNEQVRVSAAGNANHAVVEILDPAVDDLAIAQLNGDADLAIAERAKIERFLTGIARRGRSGAAQMGKWRIHQLDCNGTPWAGQWLHPISPNRTGSDARNGCREQRRQLAGL